MRLRRELIVQGGMSRSRRFGSYSEFVGEGAFEFSQMAAVVQAASEKANRM